MIIWQPPLDRVPVQFQKSYLDLGFWYSICPTQPIFTNTSTAMPSSPAQLVTLSLCQSISECVSQWNFDFSVFRALQSCYISFSVLFQTKSSLVLKSYTQKLRTIFQTNSSLFWKEKNWFCKTHIPKQIQIGLENFDDHCQCPQNSKPNSVRFGKIIDYYQHLEPWTISSFIL